jgi:hypothetical protein
MLRPDPSRRSTRDARPRNILHALGVKIAVAAEQEN